MKSDFLLFQLNQRRKKKQVAKIFMTIDKKKVQTVTRLSVSGSEYAEKGKNDCDASHAK